jgi:hypothetical protein
MGDKRMSADNNQFATRMSSGRQAGSMPNRATQVLSTFAIFWPIVAWSGTLLLAIKAAWRSTVLVLQRFMALSSRPPQVYEAERRVNWTHTAQSKTRRYEFSTPIFTTLTSRTEAS